MPMPWTTILRWVMIVAWFAHGIGTLANVVVAAGVKIGFPNKPPVVSILASSPMRYVAAAVWLVVAVGYIAAAIGLLTGAPWWPVAAWVAAPLSIVMILLYWPAVPSGEQYGGQLVNAATIAYLILGPK
jgi:uncharacterized membrane protein YphA (DoxX/SURF4 family)